MTTSTDDDHGAEVERVNLVVFEVLRARLSRTDAGAHYVAELLTELYDEPNGAGLIMSVALRLADHNVTMLHTLADVGGAEPLRLLEQFQRGYLASARSLLVIPVGPPGAAPTE